MSESKNWWTSRTLWVNAASLVVVALGGVLDVAGVLDLTARDAAITTIALAVVNAWLRLVTAQPIAGTPAAKEVPPKGIG